jgi:STE24 endopeptidase
MEGEVKSLVEPWGGGQIAVGLLLFAALSLLSGVVGLPFDYYRTFVIEERHGFNRQTVRGFWLDLVKGLMLGAILGGLILGVVLWIMEQAGPTWWIWAWLALSAISLLTAWLYPTLLAPLFNKFRPLEDGALKTAIDALASRVGFGSKGVMVMDASRRSSHGNAYFTGLFGKKRIVLFDTLIASLTPSEIVAVLAHELGHFKLRHVTLGLIRGLATTGLLFFGLSLCLELTPFYTAFGLKEPTTYGALLVFSMWFGLANFYLQPISNHISRRHEFAADRFALEHIENKTELGQALLKLREKSHSLPLSHPLYSAVYHSHPPLLERLDAMTSDKRWAQT